MVENFAHWLQRQFALNPQMNQTTLAIHIGVSQSSVSSWLRGAAKPSYENCLKLATYFNTPTEDVLHLAGYAPRQTGETLRESRPDYDDITFSQLLDLLRQLTAEQRKEVLQYALFRFRQPEQPAPPATGSDTEASADATAT